MTYYLVNVKIKSYPQHYFLKPGFKDFGGLEDAALFEDETDAYLQADKARVNEVLTWVTRFIHIEGTGVIKKNRIIERKKQDHGFAGFGSIEHQ